MSDEAFSGFGVGLTTEQVAQLYKSQELLLVSLNHNELMEHIATLKEIGIWEKLDVSWMIDLFGEPVELVKYEREHREPGHE